MKIRGMKLDNWTDATIATATTMWAEGISARKIAAAIGVNHNTLLGYALRHRDRFPRRGMARQDWQPARAKPLRQETRIGDRFVIKRVKRHHQSGEVHSMPRVSLIDGRTEA